MKKQPFLICHASSRHRPLTPIDSVGPRFAEDEEDSASEVGLRSEGPVWRPPVWISVSTGDQRSFFSFFFMVLLLNLSGGVPFTSKEPELEGCPMWGLCFSSSVWFDISLCRLGAHMGFPCISCQTMSNLP